MKCLLGNNWLAFVFFYFFLMYRTQNTQKLPCTIGGATAHSAWNPQRPYITIVYDKSLLYYPSILACLIWTLTGNILLKLPF